MYWKEWQELDEKVSLDKIDLDLETDTDLNKTNGLHTGFGLSWKKKI